ncbi:MAG: hypothetical protein ACRC62_15475 [Microcoleus sp.]
MILLSRRSRMTKKKPLLVQLDDGDRARLEELANFWGLSLSAAVRQLIRNCDVIVPRRKQVRKEWSKGK